MWLCSVRRVDGLWSLDSFELDVAEREESDGNVPGQRSEEHGTVGRRDRLDTAGGFRRPLARLRTTVVGLGRHGARSVCGGVVVDAGWVNCFESLVGL